MNTKPVIQTKKLMNNVHPRCLAHPSIKPVLQKDVPLPCQTTTRSILIHAELRRKPYSLTMVTTFLVVQREGTDRHKCQNRKFWFDTKWGKKINIRARKQWRRCPERSRDLRTSISYLSLDWTSEQIDLTLKLKQPSRSAKLWAGCWSRPLEHLPASDNLLFCDHSHFICSPVHYRSKSSMPEHCIVPSGLHCDSEKVTEKKEDEKDQRHREQNLIWKVTTAA